MQHCTQVRRQASKQANKRGAITTKTSQHANQQSAEPLWLEAFKFKVTVLRISPIVQTSSLPILQSSFLPNIQGWYPRLHTHPVTLLTISIPTSRVASTPWGLQNRYVRDGFCACSHLVVFVGLHGAAMCPQTGHDRPK